MKYFATGGCLCGDVRYSCAEKPLMSGTCHCGDCQQNTGSAFVPILIFKKESVSVVANTSKVFEHRVTAESLYVGAFVLIAGHPIWSSMRLLLIFALLWPER